MSNTLKEKITLLSEAELAELSLRETLSVEEALCDASDPAFLVETADLPVDPKDCKECQGVGDFDKYQFFNQDQIAGIATDDLHDLYDPDNQGGHTTEGDKDLNEGVSGMVAFLIGESADNAYAEMAGTLPDDDGEDDDLDTEDDDINVDEEGSELPDDFDADDFLASLEDESDD